jgi:hypothetical protein
MNDYSLSLFDGLLLGDGCVKICKGGRNAYFQQTCKSVEYLKFLQPHLEKLSIPFGSSLYWRGEKLDSWQLTSRVCDFLTVQQPRWYINRIKIVPENVIIDPVSLCHWHIGDGTLSSTHSYFVDIKLAAHSFTRDEREFLCDRVRDIGLTRPRTNNTGEIWVNRSKAQEFFEYISPCPLDYYSYKWNTKRFWRTTRLKNKKSTISSQV